ncbi:hypothetical protein BDW67DRAFT_167616 [Aspergillus spinulosporus]
MSTTPDCPDHRPSRIIAILFFLIHGLATPQNSTQCADQHALQYQEVKGKEHAFSHPQGLETSSGQPHSALTNNCITYPSLPSSLPLGGSQSFHMNDDFERSEYQVLRRDPSSTSPLTSA